MNKSSTGSIIFAAKNFHQRGLYTNLKKKTPHTEKIKIQLLSKL